MRKCYTSCRLPTRWTARAESSVSSCHGWYGDGRYRDGTRSGTSTKRHDYACSGNFQGLSFAIGAVTVYRWAASGLTRFGLLLEAPTLPAAMMPEAICAKRHRSIASLQWSANLSSCLSRSRLLQPGQRTSASVTWKQDCATPCAYTNPSAPDGLSGKVSNCHAMRSCDSRPCPTYLSMICNPDCVSMI